MTRVKTTIIHCRRKKINIWFDRRKNRIDECKSLCAVHRKIQIRIHLTLGFVKFVIGSLFINFIRLPRHSSSRTSRYWYSGFQKNPWINFFSSKSNCKINEKKKTKQKQQNKLFYSVSIKTFHFSLGSSN